MENLSQADPNENQGDDEGRRGPWPRGNHGPGDLRHRCGDQAGRRCAEGRAACPCARPTAPKRSFEHRKGDDDRDRRGDQSEKAGEARPSHAGVARPDHDRQIHDVRSGQGLAKRQGLGEIDSFGHPAFAFDQHPAVQTVGLRRSRSVRRLERQGTWLGSPEMGDSEVRLRCNFILQCQKPLI